MNIAEYIQIERGGFQALQFLHTFFSENNNTFPELIVINTELSYPGEAQFMAILSGYAICNKKTIRIFSTRKVYQDGNGLLDQHGNFLITYVQPDQLLVSISSSLKSDTISTMF